MTSSVIKKRNKNEKPNSQYRKLSEVELRYPELARANFRKVVMLHSLEAKAADKTRRGKPKASGVTTAIRHLLPKHFSEIRKNGLTELEVKNYQKVCNTFFLKARNIDPDFLKYKSILPELFPEDEFSQTEILFDTEKTTPAFEMETSPVLKNDKVDFVKALSDIGVKRYKDSEFEIEF